MIDLTKSHAKSEPIVTAGKLAKLFLFFFAFSILILICCSLTGYRNILWEKSWKLWQWSVWDSQIWHMRIFRLLAAAAVGSALATAGMALQGLMRNPLAEPYIMGISSGAGVGVLLGSSLSLHIGIADWATTPGLALVGALITSVAVYFIAQRNGRLDPYVLLLSGVIINVFNNALILTVLQFVKQTEMINFIGWGMGQIPEWLWFNPKLLIICSALIISGWLIIFLRASSYNTLGLGDEVAASSGVSVHWIRTETFILISLMTSAAVALAGPVGFVGLIVPHICRLIFGPDHRYLAIVCGFGGAIFLMLADTSCRIIGESFHLGELPVGVVTAITGGPFFIFLLRKRRKEPQR